MDKLGLVATAGIGPNMFLAKNALDHEGKKRPPYVAYWEEKDIKTKLWSIPQLTDIWGIGNGISNHLKRIGIRTMRELALADIHLLEKEFGVIGYQLHELANGRDDSDIQEKYIPLEKSLTNGQTLNRAYTPKEALLVLREMNDDLANRLRAQHLFTSKVSVWVGYGDFIGGGYAKQSTLDIATDDTDTLYENIKRVFLCGVEERPIRGLSIAYGKISNPQAEQCSLFEDYEKRDEKRMLDYALDAIKAMFGKSKVVRCSALLEPSTVLFRNEMIGGHKR